MYKYSPPEMVEKGKTVPRKHRAELEEVIDDISVDDLREYAHHAALVADIHDAAIAYLAEMGGALETLGKQLEAEKMATSAAVKKVLGFIDVLRTSGGTKRVRAEAIDDLRKILGLVLVAIEQSKPIEWPDIKSCLNDSTAGY